MAFSWKSQLDRCGRAAALLFVVPSTGSLSPSPAEKGFWDQNPTCEVLIAKLAYNLEAKKAGSGWLPGTSGHDHDYHDDDDDDDDENDDDDDDDDDGNDEAGGKDHDDGENSDGGDDDNDDGSDHDDDSDMMI